MELTNSADCSGTAGCNCYCCRSGCRRECDAVFIIVFVIHIFIGPIVGELIAELISSVRILFDRRELDFLHFHSLE